MKKTILIIILSPLILLMACKKKSPEGSCADPIFKELSWNIYSLKPWKDATFTTFMENGHRIFQVETPAYGNVCPGKDVNCTAKCGVFTPNSGGSPIWMVFYYRYGNMMDHGNSAYNFDPSDTQTKFEFNIQDAYPTGAGAFYFIIQWKIISPTSDPVADLAYFQGSFSFTELIFNYTVY